MYRTIGEFHQQIVIRCDKVVPDHAGQRQSNAERDHEELNLPRGHLARVFYLAVIVGRWRGCAIWRRGRRKSCSCMRGYDDGFIVIRRAARVTLIEAVTSLTSFFCDIIFFLEKYDSKWICLFKVYGEFKLYYRWDISPFASTDAWTHLAFDICTSCCLMIFFRI